MGSAFGYSAGARTTASGASVDKDNHNTHAGVGMGLGTRPSQSSGPLYGHGQHGGHAGHGAADDGVSAQGAGVGSIGSTARGGDNVQSTA